ncbi:MAG TPA: hypothetical protein ENI66_01500, partial [Candidatus Yonathbacteria bacterium]|nr:hypothetical protein [Candidatus Yonathbacteria bacterium]
MMLLNKKNIAMGLVFIFFLFIASFALFGFNGVAQAQTGILQDPDITCTGVDCQLCNVFQLINVVIRFLMFSVAAPLA